MGGVGRFNRWLAVKVTAAVGTMWCAYAFCGLGLVMLPDALHRGLVGVAQWAAGTLSLVLFSVVMVGQRAQADSVRGLRQENATLLALLQVHLMAHREAQRPENVAQ